VAFSPHTLTKPAASRRIHAEFTTFSPPKPSGCATLRVALNCCAIPGFALFDKSASIAYNSINMMTYTDKGKLIERWGRKATGLR
jgi:hypothetical protein